MIGGLSLIMILEAVRKAWNESGRRLAAPISEGATLLASRAPPTDSCDHGRGDAASVNKCRVIEMHIIVP
jgi:hypothetical protein